MLIADCLKAHEDVNKLHPDRAGWYRYLFNAIASKSPEDLSSTPVTIVTFNYDRSVEAYFHQSIRNRWNLGDKQAIDVLRGIRIIHLHGILGDYPDVPYTAKQEGTPIDSISKKICIIHQLEDSGEGFCSEEFEVANRALNDSRRIFFLGFGFHEDNIRRLKFFSTESMKGREVHSTSYGLQKAEKQSLIRRLSKYGFTGNHFTIYQHDCHMFLRHHATLD